MTKNLTITVHAGLPKVRGSAQNCDFSDTNETLIQEFCQAGIITGYPDGSFKSSNTINRAELATVVYKLFGDQNQIRQMVGILEDNSISPFQDTPGDHWAAAYISLGKLAGSLQGYPNALFIGHQDIIRSEAWKLMTDAAAAIDPTLKEVIRQIQEAGENDLEEPWFQAYHELGKQIGMSSYVEFKTKPSWQIMAEPISRLEVLQFLNQLLTTASESRS